ALPGWAAERRRRGSGGGRACTAFRRRRTSLRLRDVACGSRFVKQLPERRAGKNERLRTLDVRETQRTVEAEASHIGSVDRKTQKRRLRRPQPLRCGSEKTSGNTTTPHGGDHVKVLHVDARSATSGGKPGKPDAH